MKAQLICLTMLLVSSLNALGQSLAPSASQPFILTQTPREPMSGSATLSTPYATAPATVEYFDGLGRPLQTVQWRGSGSSTVDLMGQTISYDAYGRPISTVLPTPSPNGTGAFVSTTVTTANAQTFYGDAFPYGQTGYETSPLNRVTAQQGPGVKWQSPTLRQTTQLYGTAPANSVIRFFFNGKAVAVYGHIEGQTSANYYGANDISTQLTTDEQGNQVTTYTDLQGRMVQKTVRVASGQLLTTAYVYDGFERLTVVLPPVAYNWFMADLNRDLFFYINGAENPVFREMAYAYLYDDRSRVCRKHVPGAGWTDLVYNNQDRLVMSQDDQDRTETGGAKWRYSKYDALGRTVQTGRLTSALSATTLQASFTALSGEAFPPSVNSTTADMLTENFYDNYTGAIFSFSSAGAFALPFPSTANPNATGLLTRSRTRNLELPNTWYETVLWYDDKARVIQSQRQNHLGGTDCVDTQYRFNGEVLQTVLRHQPGAGTPMVSVTTTYAYDHLGRRTQLGQTITGESAVKLASYAYDPIGRLQTKTLAEANQGGSARTVQSGVWTSAATWQAGVTPSPLSSVSISAGHRVSIPANTTVLAGNLYDAGSLTLLTGSLLRLNGGAGGTAALFPQVVNYNWHIRGGLRGMNLTSGNSLTALTPNQVFALKLDYEDAGYYDGNIGCQTWINGSQPSQIRSYTYAYDGASRLTSASYVTGAYSLSGITYDANGNILSLKRGAVGSLVDALSYSYTAGTNKLEYVTDASSNTLGFVDGNTTGNDYEYYPDGSLKKDLNRGITLIEYNHLKLPRRVTLASSSTVNSTTVTYQYDADGRKLRMVVTGWQNVTNITSQQGSSTTTQSRTVEIRDYVGPFQYVNNQLFEISHEEGRYSPQGGYEYFHRDHLGNVRVVFGSAGITQYTDYDPWGLPLWNGLSGGAGGNRMKFNGKESVAELGAGMYDFGARVYDSSAPRFWKVDRYAEKYYGLSQYQYGANNPINNIDINGDSIVANAGGVQYSYGFREGGYGFYDRNGNLYSGNDPYLNAVNLALGRLGVGKEGRQLVDRLTASTDAIEIKNTTGGNQANFQGRSRSVDWNPNNSNGGPDEKGNTTRPAFIGLGHEMAHIEDAEYGTMNSRQGTWVNDPTVQDTKGNPLTIPNMEIYATHRENQLRAEQGVPLRTGYLPNYSGARIINVNTRSSLYFDVNGNSYFNPKNSTFSTVPKGTQPYSY